MCPELDMLAIKSLANFDIYSAYSTKCVPYTQLTSLSNNRKSVILPVID